MRYVIGETDFEYDDRVRELVGFFLKDASCATWLGQHRMRKQLAFL